MDNTSDDSSARSGSTGEDSDSEVMDSDIVKDKLYDVLQIYLVPIKKGQRNSSQLELEYDTKNLRAKVKMMVRDQLYKNVKVFDDSVMWNVCPYEKETLLDDAMEYFEYQSKDVLFKARWWYTYRTLIKRQITTKRNDSVDAMKRKFQLGKYLLCVVLF